MCRYVLVLELYLTITGNAPLGHSHLCHPFIYGSPAFPLLSLSRTPITKYYIYSCKSILAPQQKPYYCRGGTGQYKDLVVVVVFDLPLSF
jgi:hypothetical protein